MQTIEKIWLSLVAFAIAVGSVAMLILLDDKAAQPLSKYSRIVVLIVVFMGISVAALLIAMLILNVRS